MAGRKSYLEASYGCAKNMKETGTLLVQSVISETADVGIKEVDYNLGTKLNAAGMFRIGSRLRILGILSGCMILVESPNPLITKEAHQYKKADIDPASGVALHTTEVAWEHMPISREGSLSRPGATLGLRHGPDSHGGQQWGILDNGRKPDPAISRE
ncbi:Ribosomal protein S10p/S20e [Trifolium repens]|nr:Ribosomal protein S10p/S20e [Trifolium repens]